MSDNTDETSDQDLLSQVLDDYTLWYGQVLRAAYYPDQESPDIAAYPPESFEQWYNKQLSADIHDNVALEQIYTQYNVLLSAVKTFLEESRSQKPQLGQFDTLRQNYEEFLYKLRRMDYARISGEFGIDTLTELRNYKVMLTELGRELERRSRHGMPFTLVLAMIDNYDTLRSSLARDDLCDVIRKGANVINNCMRAVDDAYRLGEHEFLVSLKHTDANGGIRFCDRVKQYLIDNDVRYNCHDKQIPLTLSFCCSEPLPGDDLETVIDNLRSDLQTHYKGPGTTAVYEDSAPIERYVRSIQGE